MNLNLPNFHSMTGLWAFVILTGLFAIGSVWALPPNDLWWHARIGKDILENGHIPQHDHYSLTERGQPFYYQSWLSEILIAGLLHLGGVRLLVLARASIMTGLFGTIMLLCWWASERKRWATVPATLIAILLGISNQTVRPQLFAYLLFILLYTLLWCYRQERIKRAIWVAPLLIAAWVNVHGSFALGIVLIWLVLLGEILNHTVRNKQSNSVNNKLRTLGLVALISTLVMLINPRGAAIANYVSNMLTDIPSQTLGVEWQPPSPKSGLGKVFYPALLLTFSVLALARPPIALTDLLLTITFAWLGASGVRYIVWFGLVSAPILAEALSHLPTDNLKCFCKPPINHLFGRRLAYGNERGYPGFRRIAITTMIILLLLISALFLFYPHDRLWLTNNTGIGAVNFMEQNKIQGRLFNELARGSYLIWRLGPTQPVFIDPRFELYSLEHFETYLAISEAKENVAALLAEYEFDLLLLDHKRQADLIKFVEGQEKWREIYEDDYSSLYQHVE